MEKNIFKKNVYICMTESVCYAAEINATLYINCTSGKKSFEKESSNLISQQRLRQRVGCMKTTIKAEAEGHDINLRVINI